MLLLPIYVCMYVCRVLLLSILNYIYIVACIFAMMMMIQTLALVQDERVLKKNKEEAEEHLLHLRNCPHLLLLLLRYYYCLPTFLLIAIRLRLQ